METPGFADLGVFSLSCGTFLSVRASRQRIPVEARFAPSLAIERGSWRAEALGSSSEDRSRVSTEGLCLLLEPTLGLWRGWRGLLERNPLFEKIDRKNALDRGSFTDEPVVDPLSFDREAVQGKE